MNTLFRSTIALAALSCVSLANADPTKAGTMPTMITDAQETLLGGVNCKAELPVIKYEDYVNKMLPKPIPITGCESPAGNLIQPNITKAMAMVRYATAPPVKSDREKPNYLGQASAVGFRFYLYGPSITGVNIPNGF
jgi:hypothetical protein